MCSGSWLPESGFESGPPVGPVSRRRPQCSRSQAVWSVLGPGPVISRLVSQFHQLHPSNLHVHSLASIFAQTIVHTFKQHA